MIIQWVIPRHSLVVMITTLLLHLPGSSHALVMISPLHLVAYSQPSTKFATRHSPSWILSSASGSFSSNDGVDVVSFDLDDTLWPIKPVVDAANEAVAKRYPVLSSEDVQARMKRIRPSFPPESFSYSKLRRVAYGQLLRGASVDAVALAALDSEIGQDLSTLDAFKLWLETRNSAADEYLFDDVRSCLAELQRESVVLVAITNGRGDPDMVPSLHGVFDVVVSGEDKDIRPHRKPSPIIFQAAIARVREQCGWLGDLSNWFHVGDCLVNDVAAAQAVGMQGVFLCRHGAEDEQTEPSDNPFSTVSVLEKQARMEAAQAASPDVTVSSLRGLLKHLRSSNINNPQL